MQLLGHHRRLEPALRAELDVLEVAAAAQPGPAIGQRDRDPVRTGLEHLDGVRPPEAVVAGVGDRDPHPLARQRVPDEDDPPVVPGHAVPAVRDRPDLDRSDHASRTTVS